METEEYKILEKRDSFITSIKAINENQWDRSTPDVAPEKSFDLEALKEFECSHPGCDKPSTMLCPTCIKMKLPKTHFCSDECFHAMWKLHRHVHVKKITQGFNFSGPLRPFPYSFEGHREVPDSIVKPDYALTGVPNSSD